MGRLHNLARYGRCPHGAIAKPGNCDQCDREREAAFDALLRAAAKRMGAEPGTEVRGVFCPGHEVRTITVEASDD